VCHEYPTQHQPHTIFRAHIHAPFWMEDVTGIPASKPRCVCFLSIAVTDKYEAMVKQTLVTVDQLLKRKNSASMSFYATSGQASNLCPIC